MSADDSRTRAWGALHDPSTDAATLALIAQAHPEFADAISRHPNCYDSLRQWAASVSGEGVSTRMDAAPERAEEPADARPPHRRVHKRGMVIGVAGAAVLLVVGGGIAWSSVTLLGGTDSSERGSDASRSTTGPSATAVESESARALDGPPVYIGDELEWFLPADADVQRLFSDASDVDRIAEFGGIGESEGVRVDPEECTVWWWGDQWAVVGLREQRWGTGAVTATQFPSASEADAFYRSFAETTSSCREFATNQGEENPISTSTVSVLTTTDRTLVVRTTETGSYGGEKARILLIEGNVVVDARLDGAITEDTLQEVADLLSSRAVSARDALTEQIGFR